MTSPAIVRQFSDIPPANVADALNTIVREMNDWFRYIREQLGVPTTLMQEFSSVDASNLTDAINALIDDLNERFSPVYAAMGVDYAAIPSVGGVPMAVVTQKVNDIIVAANSLYGFMYNGLPYLAAVVAESPTTMTQAHKGALLGLFSAFQTVDVMGSTDIFFDVFGAEGAANAAINLADPDGTDMAVVGTVAMAQGYGAKGDTATGYMDTNWVPANGVRFQTTAGAILTSEAADVANTSDHSASAIGTNGGRISVVPRTGGGQYGAAMNLSSTAGTTGGTSASSAGNTLVARSGSTITVYKNGAVTDWSFTAGSSVAVVGRSLYWLARNNNGTADLFSSRYARFLMAGNYTATQAQVISDALDTYVVLLEAEAIYASSVNYGGIPVGNNTTGLGSIGSPLNTVDAANNAASARQVIRLNGNPAAPTVYTHASRLALAAGGIDSVNPLGATLRATSATEVLFIDADATVGAVTIDAQTTKPQCIELAAGSAAYTVSISGAVLQDATLYGLWTSGAASYASVELDDTTISLGSARGCINWLGKSGARLAISGGEYAITNALISGQGPLYASTTEAGCSVAVSDAEFSCTIDAAFAGASVTGIRLENVASTLDGVVLAMDGSAADKSVNGITLRPTNDGDVQDMGGFSITGFGIRIRTFAGSSAAGIWVGYDGTRVGDPSNGKLNGGVIRGGMVTGADADTQLGGMHGVAIASYADTLVDDVTVDRAGIGFVLKESNPTLQNSLSRGNKSAQILLKGAQPGTLVQYNTTISNAYGSGTHVDCHPNGGTGSSCRECFVVENNMVNDGGTNVRFVDVDIGEDVIFRGNNYFNKAGTLHPTSAWRYHGVEYATFEEWKANVEPDATNYDLGV